MEEYFELIKTEFQSYDPALLAGFAAGVVVFILELILSSKGILFSGGKKRLQEAIDKGNVIIGHQIKSRFWDKEDDGNSHRVWSATYEYELNGRKGIKHVQTTISPPSTISLYHDGKKVYTQSEMIKQERTILVIIIPVLVTIGVAFLLGYRP